MGGFHDIIQKNTHVMVSIRHVYNFPDFLNDCFANSQVYRTFPSNGTLPREEKKNHHPHSPPPPPPPRKFDDKMKISKSGQDNALFYQVVSFKVRTIGSLEMMGLTLSESHGRTTKSSGSCKTSTLVSLFWSTCHVLSYMYMIIRLSLDNVHRQACMFLTYMHNAIWGTATYMRMRLNTSLQSWVMSLSYLESFHIHFEMLQKKWCLGIIGQYYFCIVGIEMLSKTAKMGRKCKLKVKMDCSLAGVFLFMVSHSKCNIVLKPMTC